MTFSALLELKWIRAKWCHWFTIFISLTVRLRVECRRICLLESLSAMNWGKNLQFNNSLRLTRRKIDQRFSTIVRFSFNKFWMFLIRTIPCHSKTFFEFQSRDHHADFFFDLMAMIGSIIKTVRDIFDGLDLSKMTLEHASVIETTKISFFRFRASNWQQYGHWH